MTDAVEIRDLTKRYDRSRRRGVITAVDSVSLTVHAGEIFGFLGPNGAGKTTTLRMMLGLIRPTSGQVSVLGSRPGSAGDLGRVGSLIEGPAFYPYLSGQDNLEVMAAYAHTPRARIGDVLREVALTDRAGDKFATYSLGMKQRLGVAAALLKDPELVLLDEPTNGLDPAGMRDMRELVRRLGAEGRTVVLSSHLMGEVQQICERVAVIDRGTIVAEGTVDDLRGERDLVVTAAPSDVACRVLEDLPEVDAVRATDGVLRVRVDERHTAEVTRCLVSAGVAVTEVRRDERQLEEAFFEMTEHEEEAEHV